MWRCLATCISRLRFAFLRRQLDVEADQELTAHLELLTERYVRLGMTAEQARVAARRRLGNPLLVREEIYQMNSIGWLEELAADAGYGLRLLTRNPGFTMVAGLTLALGIGATSAIFSVLNTVVLAPLPFRDPQQLVSIARATSEGPRGVPIDIADMWRRESRTLEGVAHALMGQTNFTVTGPDGAERIVLEQVDVHTLRVLGVNPILGRWFQSDEVIVQGNTAQSIVISYGLWQRLFGGDPQVIGKTLPGWSAGWGDVIVGVMPRGFYTHPSRVNTDAWYVITRNPGPVTIGRLAAGVTMQQAQSELETLARAAVPASAMSQFGDDGLRIAVVPLDERYRQEYARTLYMLLGAVGFVLLIAAVNVANLQLNRGATRQAEIATRMALGAKRWRLFRQLVVENVLLVLAGGTLGVLVATVGIRLFVALAPDFYPPSEEIGIDATVLLFTLIVCVVTGILSGLAPGLRASRPDLHAALKQSGRLTDGGLRLRVRRVLVVSEIALAMVLLVGAGLMINSYARAMQVDMGIDADDVLSTRIVLLGMDQYRTRRAPGHWIASDKIAGYYTRVIERLSAVPGVDAVAITSLLPPGRGMAVPFRVPGRPHPVDSAAAYHEVSPDFFATMRIPLRSGRAFSAADHAAAPGVVIVNETFARRFFPGENAVGQILQTSLAEGNPTGEEDRLREIVGVVGDVRPSLREDFEPVMYVPYLQHLTNYPSNFHLAIHAIKDIVIRSSVPPAALAPAIRRAFTDVDAAVAPDTLTSVRARLSRSASTQSFWMRLLGIFAGLGAFLAAVGIYGVVSYTVQQRTHEFGIRTTLGAQHADIIKLVLREGASVTILGLAIGLGGAFVATRLIQNQLFGVSRMDPITIVSVAVVLLAISLFACFIPARRTTKLDPLLALRAE
jgi:predicted permease